MIRRIDLRGADAASVDYRASVPRAEFDVEAATHVVAPIIEAVRTGGADAGWHLKLPTGPDARTEVRMPLNDGPEPDEVPAELRDTVLAIVRDRRRRIRPSTR